MTVFGFPLPNQRFIRRRVETGRGTWSVRVLQVKVGDFPLPVPTDSYLRPPSC